VGFGQSYGIIRSEGCAAFLPLEKALGMVNSIEDADAKSVTLRNELVRVRKSLGME
jgi:hypothetical protein